MATSIDGSAEGLATALQTRRRITDAAARTLTRLGYAGARLSDIAADADLRTATPYYFPSRDDLIEEVVRIGTQTMIEQVGEGLRALPAHSQPLGRIDAAVLAHLPLLLEISAYTTAALRNTGQLPESMRARQLSAEKEYADLWQALFDDATQAGVLREGLDARLTRLFVLGALNWASEWWRSDRGPLEVVVRTAQSVIRHGLSAARPGAAGPSPAPTFRAATS